MEKDNQTKQLLQCLLHVIGRIAIPPEKVQDVIGSGKKQIKAFNLCDGTNNQSDIAKKTKIDPGNLHRTLNRWIQHGIIFRIGEGKDTRLLHIYSIPESSKTSKKKR